MTITKPVLCMAVAAAVSACGATTEPPVVVDARSVVIGDMPAGVRLIRNDDNTYALTDSTLPEPIRIGGYLLGPLGSESYQTIPTCDEGGICVYLTRVHHGKTPGGEGEVTFVFSPPAAYRGLDLTATELVRTGPTTIPANGSITMTGVTAIFTYYADGGYGYSAEGIAELTANFDDGHISGRTYDLQYFSGGGDLNLYAATFELTDITGGSFSGVVNPDNAAYLNGTYDGIIVGASGDQAIGAYSFVNPIVSETVNGIFMVGGAASP